MVCSGRQQTYLGNSLKSRLPLFSHDSGILPYCSILACYSIDNNDSVELFSNSWHNEIMTRTGNNYSAFRVNNHNSCKRYLICTGWAKTQFDFAVDRHVFAGWIVLLVAEVRDKQYYLMCEFARLMCKFKAFRHWRICYQRVKIIWVASFGLTNLARKSSCERFFELNVRN